MVLILCISGDAPTQYPSKKNYCCCLFLHPYPVPSSLSVSPTNSLPLASSLEVYGTAYVCTHFVSKPGLLYLLWCYEGYTPIIQVDCLLLGYTKQFLSGFHLGISSWGEAHRSRGLYGHGEGRVDVIIVIIGNILGGAGGSWGSLGGKLSCLGGGGGGSFPCAR